MIYSVQVRADLSFQPSSPDESTQLYRNNRGGTQRSPTRVSYTRAMQDAKGERHHKLSRARKAVIDESPQGASPKLFNLSRGPFQKAELISVPASRQRRLSRKPGRSSHVCLRYLRSAKLVSKHDCQELFAPTHHQRLFYGHLRRHPR